MFIFSHKMNGYYAGIENDPIRSIIFAESFKQLLLDHPQLLGNINLVYFFKVLIEYDFYDFDIIYSFDEVFAVNHWRKVMSTYLQSPRAKFWISFKALKNRAGSSALLQEMKGNNNVHSNMICLPFSMYV
jgi:hypothetical protein